jgi:hypothetical protein
LLFDISMDVVLEIVPYGAVNVGNKLVPPKVTETVVGIGSRDDPLLRTLYEKPSVL